MKQKLFCAAVMLSASGVALAGKSTQIPEPSTLGLIAAAAIALVALKKL